MNLQTDVLLDATTVSADNFTITADGTEVPSAMIAKKVDYFPLTNIMCLSIEPEYSVPGIQYRIASRNLKSINGDSVHLSRIAYASIENAPELYDVSVESVNYMQGDVIRYTWPKEGGYNVIVNLANASTDDRDVTLIYYLHNDSGYSDILEKRQLHITCGECITDIFDGSELNGQRVQVRLEK